MGNLKIKVCGLKYPGNILSVQSLSPAYMGFIFYNKTPRFVREVPAEILKRVPSFIKKTAVFVNETEENINMLINKHNFDAIQLHGDESPAFCDLFKGKVQVLKAFGINNDFDFSRIGDYKNKADFFLFDAKTDIYGGSGRTFNWSVLDNYQLDIPFFLSGGISLDNLQEIKNITHPAFYGIDLNSRFETAPGEKDIKKLEMAFEMIKQFDTHEIRS